MYAQSMDRPRKVRIHGLRSAIHGLRKSILCAQHYFTFPSDEQEFFSDSDHAIVYLGSNVSSSAHNCGCVVDGGNAMAAI